MAIINGTNSSETLHGTPDADTMYGIETSHWKSLWIYQNKKIPTKTPSCKEALINIARLGGYMNRNSDRPPGILVISRGWHILQHINSMYLKIISTQ